MDRLNLSIKEQWKLGLALGLTAAITLIGYEMARGASYTLFKFSYGTEKLPLAMAFIPLAAIASLSIYDVLLSRWGPRKTLIATTLLSAATFLICFLAIHFEIKLASAVLFVFREIYIVILIEQYWSYINSGLDKEVARKLNGPLIGISSLGSIAGGFLSGKLAESLGTANMLLIPLTLCLPAAYLSHLTYKIFGEPRAKKVTHQFSKMTGLVQLFKKPQLTLLFFIVIFTQVVATTLDLAFQNRIQVQMPQMDQQTSFLGYFFATLNGLALILQFVLTPLLLRWFKPVTAFVFIPWVNLAVALWAFVDMSIYSLGLSLLMFKAMDYSLFRATKETFYIPLSFDVRYRTKEVIDVFAYRTSKGVTSLSITLAQNFVRFTDGLFLGVGLTAIALWSALALWFRKVEVKEEKTNF